MKWIIFHLDEDDVVIEAASAGEAALKYLDRMGYTIEAVDVTDELRG